MTPSVKSIKKMGDQLKALRDAMCDEEVYFNILKTVRNTKKGTPGVGKEHTLSTEDKKAIEEIEMQLMEQGKETHGQEIEELETVKTKRADKENATNEDVSKDADKDAGEKVSADDEEAEMQVEEETARPARGGRKAATKKTPSKTASKTAAKSSTRGKAKATAKDKEPAATSKTTRTSRTRKALSTVK